MRQKKFYLREKKSFFAVQSSLVLSNSPGEWVWGRGRHSRLLENFQKLVCSPCRNDLIICSRKKKFSCSLVCLICLCDSISQPVYRYSTCWKICRTWILLNFPPLHTFLHTSQKSCCKCANMFWAVSRVLAALKTSDISMQLTSYKSEWEIVILLLLWTDKKVNMKASKIEFFILVRNSSMSISKLIYWVHNAIAPLCQLHDCTRNLRLDPIFSHLVINQIAFCIVVIKISPNSWNVNFKVRWIRSDNSLIQVANDRWRLKWMKLFLFLCFSNSSSHWDKSNKFATNGLNEFWAKYDDVSCWEKWWWMWSLSQIKNK